MKHLEVLDSHANYKYVYMDNCGALTREYIRMYGIIEASGHALMSDVWDLDSGILLKNDQEVIAGAFFNMSKSPDSILIHIIFVEENHRKQGIYTKMHRLVDQLGKELGRTEIYSYIHAENKIMQEYIMEKIGYTPVMYLVKRDV